MRRNKYESVVQVVQKMLREEGLETPLNEYRLLSAWPVVMGTSVQRYTGKTYIKAELLYVQIKSPALKANLEMARDNIRDRLNAFVGANVIRGIVFL